MTTSSIGRSRRARIVTQEWCERLQAESLCGRLSARGERVRPEVVNDARREPGAALLVLLEHGIRRRQGEGDGRCPERSRNPLEPATRGETGASAGGPADDRDSRDARTGRARASSETGRSCGACGR